MYSSMTRKSETHMDFPSKGIPLRKFQVKGVLPEFYFYSHEVSFVNSKQNQSLVVKKVGEKVEQQIVNCHLRLLQNRTLEK